MSTGLEDQLRQAFEQASEFVRPRAGLEQQLRLAARRRRQMFTAAIGAATAVIVVAAGGYVLANVPSAGHDRATGEAAPFRVHLRANADLQEVAVSDRYVYVLTRSPTSSLAAYGRATGQLVRRITVPGSDANLVVGPGGLVWFSFVPAQNALERAFTRRPAQVWLLSADLRLRSAGPIADPLILVPAGQTTAWTVSRRGLMAIHMPLPGMHDRGTEQLEPSTGIGQSESTLPGAWAGLLNARVAVQVMGKFQVTGKFAVSLRAVVIAGHPSVRFGSSRQTDILSVTSTGTSLWVVTIPSHDVAFPAYGQLVRLNSQLEPTTPAFIRANPVFASTSSAWYGGGVLWIFPRGKHGLYCIPASNPAGQPEAVTLPGDLVAVSHHTAFVSIQRGSGLTVTTVPVPTACR